MLEKITLLSFLSIPMCFGMEVENGDSSIDESYLYSSGESDCTISFEDESSSSSEDESSSSSEDESSSSSEDESSSSSEDAMQVENVKRCPTAPKKGYIQVLNDAGNDFVFHPIPPRPMMFALPIPIDFNQADFGFYNNIVNPGE